VHCKDSGQCQRLNSHLNPSRTRSYKQNFSVNYAGFCYAEILKKDFLVKNFGVAIFQRKLCQKSFIGSGPGLSPGLWAGILARSSSRRYKDAPWYLSRGITFGVLNVPILFRWNLLDLFFSHRRHGRRLFMNQNGWTSRFLTSWWFRSCLLMSIYIIVLWGPILTQLSSLYYLDLVFPHLICRRTVEFISIASLKQRYH